MHFFATDFCCRCYGWIHLQHTPIAVAFAGWIFFIVFKPKNSKKIPVGICDSYTRMLQMNPPYVVVNEI